ncbi:MAG: ComEC family competence protein [Candidatus Omnitrophica bacterium]|nr:ComEC family competence protein [Candidatus Omnitrophota bacterium]
MKRPLVSLAIVFSLGILVASRIKIPFMGLYFLAALFLALILFPAKTGCRFSLSLLGLCFCLGALFLKNAQGLLPQNHISRMIYYKNSQLYLIRGMVSSEPEVKNNKTSFFFKTQSVQSANLNRSCRGDILVYLKGGSKLHYGEELILRGNLRRPFARAGPRQMSYRDYLYRRNVYFIMRVENSADMFRLNRNKGFILKRLALWLKHKMEEALFRYASPLTAAISAAMILGEKTNIPWFVNDAMMKSGTLHILVVSGFNVGIISFIIVLFLKLFRLPRQLRFWLTVFLLVVYCLITGASTPCVRATVMSVVFLFSFLLKREPDIYSSLSAAALFILVINPMQLFDIGFQLSFVSVLAIVYLYPKLKARCPAAITKVKPWQGIINGGLVSLSAWLGTAGFIACYFKIFSPVTVLANLFIVPIATLITLCGLSLIVAGLVLPGLAYLFAPVCELLVSALVAVNTLLIKLPGAYLRLP